MQRCRRRSDRDAGGVAADAHADAAGRVPLAIAAQRAKLVRHRRRAQGCREVDRAYTSDHSNRIWSEPVPSALKRAVRLCAVVAAHVGGAPGQREGAAGCHGVGVRRQEVDLRGLRRLSATSARQQHERDQASDQGPAARERQRCAPVAASPPAATAPFTQSPAHGASSYKPDSVDGHGEDTAVIRERRSPLVCGLSRPPATGWAKGCMVNSRRQLRDANRTAVVSDDVRVAYGVDGQLLGHRVELMHPGPISVGVVLHEEPRRVWV